MIPAQSLIQSGELKDTLPKPASKEQLEARCVVHVHRHSDCSLTSLINQSPVMIFIKGTPDAPRCGFTKQLLALLNEAHVQYGYYDILGDNEVWFCFFG